MPNYTYVAVNMSGNQIKGEHTAPDEKTVLNFLRQQGYFATTVKKKLAFGEGMAIGNPKLPVKDVARLCQQMASMLRSGVPIARTLEILTEEAENKQLKTIMEDISSSIKQGSSFSQALIPHEKVFPVLFLSMVEAGEASGTLDACLDRAGISFTRAAKLNRRIKGAMIYPSIILIALIGLLILMLTVVVPQFAEIFADAGEELPAFTRGLLAVSDFLISNGLILFAVVIASIVMMFAYLRTESGKLWLGKRMLNLPMIGKLVKKVYASRFTRSLSSLTSAGVNLPQALAISSRTVLNRFLEREILKTVEEVKKGTTLSEALDNMGQLPTLVTSVTKIGEESGELEDMLVQMAEFYDEESDSAVSAMLTIMEPALILMMAAIVVPILFGVLQPMFGMVDAISDF